MYRKLFSIGQVDDRGWPLGGRKSSGCHYSYSGDWA